MKDFDDLSARARRGQLSGPEQQRLELLLDASLEAEFLHEAGLEFDAQDADLPGDGVRADRIARRVLAGVPSNVSRRSRRLSLLAVAATLCVASVGAAGAVSLGVFRSEPSAPPSAVPSARPKASGKPRPVPPSRTVSAAPTEPAPAPEASPSAVKPSAPAAFARTPSNEAAELFAEAARARREGDVGKAIALYDSLQSRYSSSLQARAADIALGMLHLKRSAPALAVTHFQRYLRHSPKGELAPEALWGEAQSLFGLGRAEDAKRSLSVLLGRYPDSAYASAARAKLEARSTEP